MAHLVPHASPASAPGQPFVREPQAYDALLLAGFGGPEGQDDVIPFLRNVTRGRGIPDERLEVVAHHYRHHGGVSPINEQNRSLKRALEAELDRRGIELPVYWGNRNWDPYLEDAVRDAHRDGRTRLLAFATSAYSSFSSCRQYREDFARVLEATGLAGEVTIDKMRPFFDHPSFVDAFVPSLVDEVRGLLDAGHGTDGLRVLFTTHSIPVDDARRSGAADLGLGEGGAYVAQHRSVARAVMRRASREEPRLAEVSWELVFQSRSGPPSQPWLEPDICDRIAELPGEGVTAIAITPIGFLSDHMEVLWDLDNEALLAAEQAGIAATRTATPGSQPAFVAGVVDMIVERAAATPPSERATASCLGPWPDICRPECCANLRAGFKPAAAGLAP